MHLYMQFVRQKDLYPQRWSYVVFKNIYSILSSFKLHLSVKHSTHWRSLNPKPVQFELFSVFLQKNIDCLFSLQSKWWPCIDHLYFLYLTVCFFVCFCLSSRHQHALQIDKGYFPSHFTLENVTSSVSSEPGHHQCQQSHLARPLAECGRDRSHHNNPTMIFLYF